MKHALPVFVALTVLAHLPYRLIALTGVAFYSTRGENTRTDNGTDQYWQCLDLADRLRRFGWDVDYTDDLHDPTTSKAVLGYTWPIVHMIRVEARLGWNARYAVLAHEGGHALGGNTDQSEAFAEAVAAVIMGSLREHGRYLAGERLDLLELLVTQPYRVYHTAAVLEGK